jgi:hypothetical protein
MTVTSTGRRTSSARGGASGTACANGSRRNARRWSVSDPADEREAASGLRDYLAYLDGALADDLRAYIHFLDSGVSPTAGTPLPSL